MTFDTNNNQSSGELLNNQKKQNIFDTNNSSIKNANNKYISIFNDLPKTDNYLNSLFENNVNNTEKIKDFDSNFPKYNTKLSESDPSSALYNEQYEENNAINQKFIVEKNRIIKEKMEELRKHFLVLSKDSNNELNNPNKLIKEKILIRNRLIQILDDKKNSLNNKDNFIDYNKLVKSSPPEVKGDMTYCSRTARKNLSKLGINDAPRGATAIKSMMIYLNNKVENYASKLPSLPDGVNVLDLFIDSGSKYQHRAVAYVNSGNWFVLDPYNKLKSNSKNLVLPIPMEEYLASKKIIGVFPYSV